MVLLCLPKYGELFENIWFENSKVIPIEKTGIYFIYKIKFNPNNNKVYIRCLQI